MTAAAVHGKEGHRPPHRPAPWQLLLLGLCLCSFLWSLSGLGGSKSSAKPRKFSEEALDQLALQLARAERPAAGWGVAARYGPTAGPSARSGKYALVACTEDTEPQALNIFAASLRRWTPATRLVAFVEEGSTDTQRDLLEAAGAEIVPFSLPNSTSLELHRLDLYRGFLSQLRERDSEAGVLLVAGAGEVLVQADPWQHPVVERLLDEDAVLFSLEGGPAVGDVPLKAHPQSQQLVEDCFGPDLARELADAPISSAGVTIGSVAAAHKYASQMLQVAYGVASPSCRGEGIDHAAHNYLLHRLAPAGNLTFFWHTRRNWESPVHAAAYGWPVVVDRQGVYRRAEGEAPPVVHQYGQAELVAQVYQAMYPLHAVRAQELRWDGPDCVEGLQLDTVRRCPQGQSEPAAPAGGDGKAGGAGDGKGTAATQAAGAKAAGEQHRAAGKGKAVAVSGGDAAKKAGDGGSKDRRRLRR